MKQSIISNCLRGSFFFLFFVLCSTAYAGTDYYCDFSVNGIYYQYVSGTTDEVAISYDNYETGRYGGNYTNYTGYVSVPATVTYNGKTYKVTAVSDHAFQECSVTTVILPSTIKSIGYAAFLDCYQLTSVNLPSSITIIRDNAFNGCTVLGNVTLPAALKSIGNSAFQNCKTFTSIDIPDGVTTIGASAFQSCSNLASISIPSSVVSVGSSAFSGTAWYTNLPNGMVYFGSIAYCYKGTMPENTTIEIKEETTSIAGSAFTNCVNLVSVSIPSSVTSIGNKAFYYCSGLKSVDIPNTVKKIENYTFAGCTSLSSVNIPNGVISIGDYAFQGCSSLKSLNVPNSITSIGYYAFSGCSGLTSVTIGSGVSEFGDYAFYGCTNLSSLEIKDGVTSIGNCTFQSCSSLSSINLPNSIISIGSNAFSGCAWIANLPDGVVYAGKVAYCYKGTMSDYTNITLKEGTLGIASYAFSSCSLLSSVTLPSSLKKIGSSAFHNCSNLTSVTALMKVPVSIDNSIFNYRNFATLYVPAGCKSAYEATDYWKEFKEIVEMEPKTIVFADARVKSICVAHWDTDGDGELSYEEAAAVATLSDYFVRSSITSFDEFAYFTGVTVIGASEFFDCTSLKSITIPNSVTSIYQGAFKGCSGLNSITIPNSVTSIDHGVFSRCTRLTSIMVESGNTKYDSRNNCNAIIETASNTLVSGCKNTTIPNSVTSIDSYAFDECSALTSVDIPNSVISIGDFAFAQVGLTSVNIPNSVNSIGNAAFYDCRGLTSVNIPNGVNSIGASLFWTCINLISVTIPESVTSIGKDAFRGCKSLPSVTIPGSVTTINDRAFMACRSLTSITIPLSVTTIGEDVFTDCDNLSVVSVEADTPISISSSTFSNRANVTLYVPAGCKAAYKAANYWKEFKEIIEVSSPYNSHLTMTGSTICKGGKIKLPVSMENEEEITAFQFDVEIPQGVTLTDVQLGERSSDSHTVDYSKQADGSYRVIAVSLEKALFSGNEGELVSLMLSADKDIESDDYSIGIKNIVLTTTSKEKLYPTDVNSVLTVLNIKQGDADGDGFVDVADIVTMIDYILDSSTSDIVFPAADMNADGEIDIFDVMIAINIVLNRDNLAGSGTRASSNMEELAVVTAAADGIMLGVNDAGRFTAFQFDIEVADGMELTEASLNGNAGDHKLYFLKNGQNSYRVMGVSMDNSTLTGSGNDLIRLSFSKGGYAQISNIVFVTPQKSKVYFTSGNSEVTGIGRIEYEQAEEIFDLSGRKIDIDRSRLPKSLYIINNKKVVIK